MFVIVLLYPHCHYDAGDVKRHTVISNNNVLGIVLYIPIATMMLVTYTNVPLRYNTIIGHNICDEVFYEAILVDATNAQYEPNNCIGLRVTIVVYVAFNLLALCVV